MAQVERTLSGNFADWLDKIEQGILNGSLSASLESESDFEENSARCSVRVFERYSYTGGNRLSLTVVLFQAEGGRIHLSATSSGGSQALFFKINSLGENAFLDKLLDLIDSEEAF